MRRRSRPAAVLCGVLALAVSVPQAGAAAKSGVRGVLRLSHGCPGPVREGDTRHCDFAGVGVLVRAFTPGGATLGGDRTDARGRFAIALPPGRYVLHVELATGDDPPHPVRVRRASWATVTLRDLVPPYMA